MADVLETAPPADGARSQSKGRMPAPYEGFEQMPIAGVWREGRSGILAVDRDPYTGEMIVQIAVADVQDLDEAFRAAAAAQPAWSETPATERCAVLERAAHIVELRKAEIIEWLIRESGSVRAKAELEWQFALQGLYEATAYPLHVEGRIEPSSVPGKESRVYRGSVGVVGVITPWTFPLHLSIRSVAPALAVGNTVVLKPASETPVTGGLLLAKIFDEAGLPASALSVVCGAGRDIGDAFVDHPVPRIIAFTGSTAVGRHIAAHAGHHIKRLCLELGGNTPFIVFEDADLERALDAAVAGKFLHQGQSCVAINRLLVHARHFVEFRERYVQRVRALKVGDPWHADTAIGPLINRAQLEDVLRKVDATISHGARVLLRGVPRGLVLPPIVLANVTNHMPTAKEEVVGPVASLMRFTSEEEVIRIANDTEAGLSSAVFTHDVERGVRVAKRLQVGMTHINDWPVNDEANTAFGGEKESGLGRFGGEWAIAELTTDHWISVQDRPRRYPI
jgi:aldehyde dehydrogenase (NAD+)